MAFCRRLARVSALLQTPPKSLAGSPGLFEPPSDEVVGQTPPRLPYSSGPSTWEAGEEVDIFFGNRGLSKRLFTLLEMGSSRIFSQFSRRAQAFAFQQVADQCIRPCRSCFISYSDVV